MTDYFLHFFIVTTFSPLLLAGDCSGDSPRKRQRYGDDEDDEDDQSNCTAGQTVTSVEETPSKADSREQLG